MAYRYLGNKSRITDWLLGNFSAEIPLGARVVDAMCGTGSVSAALAGSGYLVTAADQLRFPVLHAKARLLYSSDRHFKAWGTSYPGVVQILNGVPPLQGFFWTEYSDEGKPANGCHPRKYFTGANASKIDAIRASIAEWREDGLHADACDLLLHDLILAANSVANIAGTYGYYRSTWNSASLSPLSLKISPRVPRAAHRVLHGKLEDLADGLEGDAAYIDPPYTKRQYGGNYHILETLAREDFPEPAGEGGLRDWYPEASDFCYRRRAGQALRECLKRLDMPVIFISYSEDGHLRPDEMMDLLTEYGDVERNAQPIGRFRSNGGKEGSVHEHLYVVRRGK